MTPAILQNPPPEAEIAARWHPEKGCLVSICMLAYNHAPYIRDALNAILNQETDFGFEILIHDDASQDETPEIVQDYAARYPAIVKPICQTVNQYSQGISPSVRFNYPRATRPFVAMCEGDDHWTDKHKLQRQVDGLLAHPDIDLSFHPAVRVNYLKPGHPGSIMGDYALEDTIIPFTDMLHRTRGWIPFAGCVIRQSAKERFLAFLTARSYLTVGDIYFQFFGSLAGGALFLAKPMSLYRYGTDNSWTRNVLVDARRKIKHERAMIRSYVELDALTDGAYHRDFLALMLQRLRWLFNPPPPPEVAESAGLETLRAAYERCHALFVRNLSRLETENKRYLVFGCGSGCQLVLDSIASAESVLAIIDRDNRHVGEIMYGKPVVGTEALAEFDAAELLVSTLPTNHEAIEALAAAHGFDASRIHYLFDDSVELLDARPIPMEALCV